MKILQELLVPQESVNDQTLTVASLQFKTGDFVNNNDVLIELETSKAIVTLEANTDGYITYYCKVDDEMPLNALLIQITDKKPENSFALNEIPDLHKTSAKPGIPIATTDKQSLAEYDTYFSKKALLIMEKNNLAKTLFKNYDFVNERIVLKFLSPEVYKNKTSELPLKELISFPTIRPEIKNKEFLSKVSFEKLSSAKRREIDYLSAVQINGLVSTLYIDIDTKGIIDAISGQLVHFRNSILPLIIFETSKLLLKYPLLNSYFDNGQIGKYMEINIGLAIDIDDGLKVAKIPKTSDLNILEIEDKIFQLSNKYLDKKLEINDFTNITFTITDLSAADIYFFTPLINKGNSAILGVSKINNKTDNCVLSLSFDHRVTCGKYVGGFLAELKSRIESFAISTKKIIPVMECYKCLKNIAKDCNDIGFIKVQTKNGEEKLICDTCLSLF